MVALDAAANLLGTAALKADSAGSEAAPGPWLAAIIVSPDHRRQGVGTALVTAIEAAAAAQGFAEIYTSTDAAAGIMIRRGWTAFGETTSLQGPIRIFRKALTGA